MLSSVLRLALLWGWLTSATSFKRVCYFTNWSGDLLIPKAYFNVEDIDARLCSHLVYAFANIHRDSLQLLSTRPDDQGEDGEVGRYVLFNNLKKNNPGLVTLLSVGGSLQASEGFAIVVENAANRQRFASHCVEFLRRWGFDGLDVDWEYPGDPPETRSKFTHLLLELRTLFEEEAESSGRTRLVLSLAAPVSEDLMTRGYEIAQVSSLVDFINVMAYDFHGKWNHITGFNAPLYSRKGNWQFTPNLNVEWAVNTWMQRGAPAHKIVVGIAGYGASYTLADNTSYDVGAEVTGPGKPGPYRVMDGLLAYYEVCELIEKQGAVYMWDEIQEVPYVHVNYTWVGYDDERSVAVKTEWMIEKNLGGVMLWSLDLDDYKGSFCDRGEYPLLRSIVKTVAAYFDDVIIPPARTSTVTAPTTTATPSTTVTTSTARPTSPTTTEEATVSRTTSGTRTTFPTTVRTSTTTTTKPTTRDNFVYPSTRPPPPSPDWDLDNQPDWVPTKTLDNNANDNEPPSDDTPSSEHGNDIAGNDIVGQNSVEAISADSDTTDSKIVDLTSGSFKMRGVMSVLAFILVTNIIL